MVELKNSKGKLGCLLRVDDIKQVHIQKEEGEAKGLVVITMLNDEIIACSNNIEDINSQIKRLKM